MSVESVAVIRCLVQSLGSPGGTTWERSVNALHSATCVRPVSCHHVMSLLSALGVVTVVVMEGVSVTRATLELTVAVLWTIVPV